MSTQQPTPGPLTYRRNFDRTGEYEIYSGETAVSIICNRGDNVPEESNARLMAAAPDLLNALQMLADVDFGACEWRCEAEIAAIKARAAISKATGEIT